MYFTKYDWGGSVLQLARPIIFGKMRFLLMSENEFFHEIKRDGIASFQPESIHTKDESKRGFAFAFIFGVN